MALAGGTCLYAEVGKSGTGGAAFKSPEEVAAAIASLNGSSFEGVMLQVDVWTKKETWICFELRRHMFSGLLGCEV